jgi:hypothetical protein
MGLETNAHTNATLTAYIDETWTPITMEEFFAKRVAANFFRDLSPFAQDGSDIFHVPDVFTNAFTVSTQSTQATELTTDKPTSVDVTLTVNNHVYIAQLIGDLTMGQIAKGIYDIGEIYARKAGGTLAEDLESDIFSQHSSITTNSIGDTATVITDSEIRQSIEKLMTADVPRDECAFFFHPYSYWIQIIQIQKYYDASQTGWDKGTAANGGLGMTPEGAGGLHGSLFGFPVFVSSQVVNTLLAVRNLFAHRDSIMYATQTPGGSQIRFQTGYEHRNLATLATWDMINGLAVTREATAVKLNGSNAFIAS